MVIRTGNSNEEVFPILGKGPSCAKCSLNVRRGAKRQVCVSYQCYFHRSEGIRAETYDIMNGEVSWLTMEVKRGIRQSKVLEVKGMSVMWRALKNLTDNKLKNNTRIITVYCRACGSQRIKANALASPPARSKWSSLTSINQMLQALTKSIQNSFVTWAPMRFLLYNSF